MEHQIADLAYVIDLRKYRISSVIFCIREGINNELKSLDGFFPSKALFLKMY